MPPNEKRPGYMNNVHGVPVDPVSRNVFVNDRSTNKMVQYDQEGHLKYAWGTMGNFAGGLWGVHGVSVDSDGNFYVAEVDSGRVQKFKPRPGANPAYLVAKPVKPVW